MLCSMTDFRVQARPGSAANRQTSLTVRFGTVHTSEAHTRVFASLLGSLEGPSVSLVAGQGVGMTGTALTCPLIWPGSLVLPLFHDR